MSLLQDLPLARGQHVRLITPLQILKGSEPSPVIRHIVLFSAKRSEDVDTILAALARLRQIPEAKRLEVVRNARLDQLSGEIDVIVHGEFEDAEALARYKAHAIYQETIGVVRPLRDVRIAVDYEVPIP
jgi:stress responsive alpha/beta barrel protein